MVDVVWGVRLRLLSFLHRHVHTCAHLYTGVHVCTHIHTYIHTEQTLWSSKEYTKYKIVLHSRQQGKLKIWRWEKPKKTSLEVSKFKPDLMCVLLSESHFLGRLEGTMSRWEFSLEWPSLSSTHEHLAGKMQILFKLTIQHRFQRAPVVIWTHS